MNTPGSSDHPVRTFRLDEAGIAALLDKMDETAGHAENDKRNMDRYSYRAQSVVIYMQQPGSSTTTAYLVPTRDISSRGMSFLHGGFVHQSTMCLVRLLTTFGTWEDVPGCVVYCRYVEQGVHNVGLKFEHSIDPSNFTFSAVRTRILLADVSGPTAQLGIFHLTNLNADVVHVETGQSVLNAVAMKMFDILLIEMAISAPDGFETTKTLRQQGYTGQIIALTDLTQPEDKKRCLEAGCDKYVPKPYTQQDLATLLKSVKAEPLLSQFHNDASFAPLIEAFIAELPQQIRSLEEALAKRDLQLLEETTRKLKAQGSSYGFEPITEEAQPIEESVIHGADFDAVREAVGKLIQTCRLVRSSSDQGKEKAES